MTDVDIIATHPDIQVFKGLCGRLTKRLQDVGIVSHLFRRLKHPPSNSRLTLVQIFLHLHQLTEL